MENECMPDERLRIWVVCIGTELTTGHIHDRNAYHIAHTLSKVGCSVESMQFVPDTYTLMESAVLRAIKHADFVIVTGGLGPTEDDFTKQVLLKIFGGSMQIDTPSLERIQARYHSTGIPMLERNTLQAAVPSSCTPLLNRWGSAPGMLFRKDECTLISLPGVPREMQGMLAEYVVPMLQKVSHMAPRTERLYGVCGLAESVIAERLQEWEKNLAPHFTLAYLPTDGGIVRLRLLSVKGRTEELEEQANTHTTTLHSLLGNALYTTKGEELPHVTVEMLKEKQLSIATAESCTGGLVGASIVAIAGASEVYHGGIIAYSETVKSQILHVPTTLLQEKGAVSEEVALAMAEGARHTMQSNIAVATTGLLGPDGDGSPTPVGTVYCAVVSAKGQTCKKYMVQNTRALNAKRIAHYALNLVRMHCLQF